MQTLLPSPRLSRADSSKVPALMPHVLSQALRKSSRRSSLLHGLVYNHTVLHNQTEDRNVGCSTMPPRARTLGAPWVQKGTRCRGQWLSAGPSTRLALSDLTSQNLPRTGAYHFQTLLIDTKRCFVQRQGNVSRLVNASCPSP